MYKTKACSYEQAFWRRHPDLNWGIKLLQSSAFPLGYGAVLYNMPKAQRILQGYYFYPLCQSTFAIIPQVMGKSQDLFLFFFEKIKNLS